jgi:hypothetical protein
VFLEENNKEIKKTKEKIEEDLNNKPTGLRWPWPNPLGEYGQQRMKDNLRLLAKDALFVSLALFLIFSWFEWRNSTIINNLFPLISFPLVFSSLYLIENKFFRKNTPTKREIKPGIGLKKESRNVIFLLIFLLFEKGLFWFKKNGWKHSIALMLICFLFLGFGISHLGNFMSVDEPKWANIRVPQFYDALKKGDWSKTFINDKPGVVPAFLSGFVNFFISHDEFKSNPTSYERYLFWWRLPILFFNFILLFFIYHFTEKLINKNQALLTTGLIALNPIIVGVSQIVNPDATLWSLGFLSFLTFFLYIKTNAKKYIYYSGIFLGFALLSKYFIAIYYPLFFLIIYFNFLFKKENRFIFFKKCIDLVFLYTISLLVYTLFFPATWNDNYQIIKGTIGSEILSTGAPIFIIFLFIIFAEIIFLKGRITTKMTNDYDFSKNLIIFFTAINILLFFSLLANIVLDNKFFDFNNYITFEFIKRDSAFFKNFISSFYITIMTLNPILIIGFFGIFFVRLNNKKDIEKLIILSSFVLIYIFLIGSSLGGFVAEARYQIILYPIYALLASYTIMNFLTKKIFIPLILVLSIIILLFSHPYYLHYENFLNLNNYKITDAWGYGGYELAQILNKLPNAKETTVWTDREGFGEFYVGKTLWRGTTNPFESDIEIDYFILTEGGRKIFHKALNSYREGNTFLYSKVAGETPLLSYYQKKPDYVICINNNPNNCVWAIKK